MLNSGRIRVGEEKLNSPTVVISCNQQGELVEEQKEVKSPNEENSSSNGNVVITNLDRFMKYTTPIVTAQHFPKTIVKDWENDECKQPYFVLGDLWESFRESSAYGTGVPLVLDENNNVVQYYSTYLSAIQLYVDPSTTMTSVRMPDEQSDSSSDGGYEAVVPDNNIDSIAQSFNKLGLNEGEFNNPLGRLAYQYFEKIVPYDRPPLAEKAMELADDFPMLRTYRSCDLTPSSWFSVAWYPIYRIPPGSSLQNMDSCFLTFHSLSTPSKGTDGDGWGVDGKPCSVSLPSFGLAVYKYRSCDWTPDDVHGIEKVNSLVHSTDDWLRKLDVHHPDFVFFKNRSCLW